MKHRPRRRFAQNFLTDAGVIAAIIAAIRPARGDRILEIGPGEGALTRPLLAAVGGLDAIEIDRDLAAALRTELAPGLTVHVGDVLNFDFATLGSELRIVGNLPYNISTPLLFRLARFGALIRDIHVMLQKEVVARMVAAPAASAYGRLSVMLQYHFEMQPLLAVPATAFRPVPAVDSAVVRLSPRQSPPCVASDAACFARVVAAAFSQRRKTLRNSLRSVVTEAELRALALAPEARAQELSVGNFVAIANHVSRRDAHSG